MSLTARVLPVEEWPRLEQTSARDCWRDLDPRHAEVLVVERDGAIVGQVLLLSVLHAECLESDGPAIARALIAALAERVQAAGGQAVWGAAADDDNRMQRLLTRHAEPIPGTHFLMRMPCHQS